MTDLLPRVSAPLAAVLPAHAVAALLGADGRAFAKRLRAGRVEGAVRSFESTGYILGWRSVVRLITREVAKCDQPAARERLLALRAGTIRVVDGRFVPSNTLRVTSSDVLEDDGLAELVRRAEDDGAAHTPAAFDGWSASNGHGLSHRDVMVRLSVTAWGEALYRCGVRADAERTQQEPAAFDLNDPLGALRQAALKHGSGGGRELSALGFDRWAVRVGSAVRSDEVRRLYGGWNAGKAAAGLEVNDHPSQASR